MRVELVKPIPGKAYFEGDVIDMPDEQARAWCESGHAIPALSKSAGSPPDSGGVAAGRGGESTEAPAPLTAETASILVSKGRGKRR